MLFKDNRPVGNKKFNTYEKCRQWARKLARRVDQYHPDRFWDMSDVLWRTPSLGQYGYSIRSV